MFQLPCRNLRCGISDKRVQQLRSWHLPVERRTIGVYDVFGRPVFPEFGELLRELQCWKLPTKHGPGIMCELCSWKLLSFDKPDCDHGVSSRKLLWHDGAFSRVRDMCRGLLCGGLCLALFGLCRGYLHLKRGAKFVPELPIGNL